MLISGQASAQTFCPYLVSACTLSERGHPFSSRTSCSPDVGFPVSQRTGAFRTCWIGQKRGRGQRCRPQSSRHSTSHRPRHLRDSEIHFAGVMRVALVSLASARNAARVLSVVTELIEGSAMMSIDLSRGKACSWKHRRCAFIDEGIP